MFQLKRKRKAFASLWSSGSFDHVMPQYSSSCRLTPARNAKRLQSMHQVDQLNILLVLVYVLDILGEVCAKSLGVRLQTPPTLTIT